MSWPGIGRTRSAEQRVDHLGVLDVGEGLAGGGLGEGGRRVTIVVTEEVIVLLVVVVQLVAAQQVNHVLLDTVPVSRALMISVVRRASFASQKVLAALLKCEHLLLDRVFDGNPVNVDCPLLADAVDPGDGLLLDRRVDRWLQQEDVICADERQALRSGLLRDQEHLDVVVLSERVDGLADVLGLADELDVGHLVGLEGERDHLESLGELAEDQALL